MKEDSVCFNEKFVIAHDDEMQEFIWRTISTMVFPVQCSGKSKTEKRRTDKRRRDREDYTRMLSLNGPPVSFAKARKINFRASKAMIRGVMAGDFYRRICFYRLQGMEKITPHFLEWAIQKGAFPSVKKNGYPVSEIRHVLSGSQFKRVGHLWAADCYIRPLWKASNDYKTLDALIVSPGLFLAFADFFRTLAVRVGFIGNKQEGAWMPRCWKKVLKPICIDGTTMTDEWVVESENIEKLYQEYQSVRAWER